MRDGTAHPWQAPAHVDALASRYCTVEHSGPLLLLGMQCQISTSSLGLRRRLPRVCHAEHSGPTSIRELQTNLFGRELVLGSNYVCTRQNYRILLRPSSRPLCQVLVPKSSTKLSHPRHFTMRPPNLHPYRLRHTRCENAGVSRTRDP